MAQVVIVLCPGLPHFSTLVFVLHGSKRAAKNREVQDMREGGGGVKEEEKEKRKRGGEGINKKEGRKRGKRRDGDGRKGMRRE